MHTGCIKPLDAKDVSGMQEDYVNKDVNSFSQFKYYP